MADVEVHPSLLRELTGKEAMPKIPVLTLPRPQPKTLTRTFIDPERPDLPITLTLRSLANDPHSYLIASDRAKEFQALYTENWYPHAGSGTAIQITESVAETVCFLEAMQSGPPEEVYTREEVLGIMLSLPGAWVQIATAVGELSETREPPEEVRENGHPNSSRVPASTSSAPAETAASDTPTS